MTDRKAILAQYDMCKCDGHTCGRCYTNAAQLRAWNLLPVEESQPAGEPDMNATETAPEKPVKRKKNRKGGDN